MTLPTFPSLVAFKPDSTPVNTWLHDQLGETTSKQLENWGFQPDSLRLRNLILGRTRGGLPKNPLLLAPSLDLPNPEENSVEDILFTGDPREVSSLIGPRSLDLLRLVYSASMKGATQAVFSDRVVFQEGKNGGRDFKLTPFLAYASSAEQEGLSRNALLWMAHQIVNLRMAKAPISHLFTLAFLSNPGEMAKLFPALEPEDLAPFSQRTLRLRTELIQGWNDKPDQETRRTMLKEVLAQEFDGKAQELRELHKLAQKALQGSKMDPTVKKNLLGDKAAPYIAPLERLLLMSARLRGKDTSNLTPITAAGLILLNHSPEGTQVARRKMGGRDEWVTLAREVRLYHEIASDILPNVSNPSNFGLSPDFPYMEAGRVASYLSDLAEVYHELVVEFTQNVETFTNVSDQRHYRTTHRPPLDAKLGLLRGAMKGAAEAWLFHRFLQDAPDETDGPIERLNRFLNCHDPDELIQMVQDGTFIRLSFIPILLKLQQLAQLYPFLRALDSSMDFARKL